MHREYRSTCNQATHTHKIKIKKKRNKQKTTQGGKTKEKTEVKRRKGKVRKGGIEVAMILQHFGNN